MLPFIVIYLPWDLLHYSLGSPFVFVFFFCLSPSFPLPLSPLSFLPSLFLFIYVSPSMLPQLVLNSWAWIICLSLSSSWKTKQGWFDSDSCVCFNKSYACIPMFLFSIMLHPQPLTKLNCVVDIDTDLSFLHCFNLCCLWGIFYAVVYRCSVWKLLLPLFLWHLLYHSSSHGGRLILRGFHLITQFTHAVTSTAGDGFW